MDADGGSAHRVTRAGGGPFESSYGEPLVSPDGRKVLVAEHGVSVVFLADGSRRRLGPGEEYSASWAPDSRRIVISGAQNRGLVIADLHGRRRHLLGRGLAWSPAWSPDGRWIAYVAERSTLVLGFPVTGGGPSWSPDGARLAYVTAAGKGNRSAIFTIHPDGRGRRRLALGVPDAATPAPVWSPDARRLLFERGSPSPGGRYRELLQIWSMRADGADKRQLTHGYPDGGANFDPAWARGPVRSEPSRRPVEKRRRDRLVLRVPFPVDGVSADGGRVAIAPAAPNHEAINAPSPPFYVWRPRTGEVMRLVGSPCVSADQVRLAADRLAFDCDQSGTDVVAQSLRVYDLASRRPTEVFFGHNGGASISRGVYLDRIEGAPARPRASSSPQTGDTSRSSFRTDGCSSWRPTGACCGFCGRRRPQPRFFAPHPRREILAGDRLIVRIGRPLHIYDADSGALRHSWPARGTLEAADGGLAISASGRELDLLRLRDGRTWHIRIPTADRELRHRLGYFFERPVHADLTSAGLFYSYNTHDRRDPGRIVFVPRANLPG
jgi:dipeptidyl aminopeptidase/acylaminoacyl peptidase